jgi:hypothetical protein
MSTRRQLWMQAARPVTPAPVASHARIPTASIGCDEVRLVAGGSLTRNPVPAAVWE